MLKILVGFPFHTTGQQVKQPKSLIRFKYNDFWHVHCNYWKCRDLRKINSQVNDYINNWKNLKQMVQSVRGVIALQWEDHLSVFEVENQHFPMYLV